METGRFHDGLVSVIIPVYRAEKYIDDCVRSALNQEGVDLEIVIVDDCSPDGSAEKIRVLMRERQNIIYDRLGVNSGAGTARNRALELASGRYAAFLDSDDIWLPGKLQRQLALMSETGAILVYGAIEMIDGQGRLLRARRKIPPTIDYRGLLRNTCIATSTVLIDRAATGDFRMPLRRSSQDYSTWLRLLRGGQEARGVTDVVTRYRVAENSLSSRKFSNWKKVYDIQVRDEGVSPVSALVNCAFYAFNAVRKYFLK